ncbi:hypothetical protein ANA_C13491 [Anabaena sp. 90]|nr:hypothetical protein ANA_C13491 [Anabaena sp. 90]
MAKQVEQKLISHCHYCHLPSCCMKVKPQYLMCSSYWKLVPAYLQALVYKNYRQGQEIDKKPSQEYLRVSQLAIQHVIDTNYAKRCQKKESLEKV